MELNSQNNNQNNSQINNQYYCSPSNLDSVATFETNNLQKNFKDAKNATQSNIIPRHFQQNIFNNGNDDNARKNKYPDVEPSFNLQKPIANFTSQLTGTVIENFGHSNMQPFYKGNKTHNVDFNNGATLLEKHQGSSQILRKKKTEVENFSDRKPNMSYTHGAPNTLEAQRSRYVDSTFQTNQLPFKQVRVGRGLNQGYTSKPSGGFQQANTREFANYKTVDELRVKSNPKLTYEGRVVNGQKGSTRGYQAKVKKNKVNAFYNNSPERYLKTGSSHIRAAMIRNKFYMKPQKRGNHKSYYGGLRKEVANQSRYAAIRASRKNNYMNKSPRNATLSNQWSSSSKNQEVSDYGRSGIENKPNERDITQKRRHVLNISTEIKKLIAPITDIFRKTRKENFIGNIRPEGNMKAAIPSKMTVYDSNDIARTTIKETTIHNNRTGNVATETKKGQVVDYEDVARTTIKETTIHNSPNTNMTPQQPKSITVYDPEDVPDTTLKETLIHDPHSGFMQSPNVSKTGGYLTNRYKATNTNRQFTSDYEYNGNADGNVGKGGGKGYLTSRYKAKNTNKQFTSDYEYSGNAKSSKESHRMYNDMYNARTNATKEKIAKGRAPTQNSVKLNAGEDLVNVQFKKLEGDRINLREPSEQRVFQSPPTKNECGMTITKEKLAENVQRERINPDYLKAFRDNPYTQSLSSSF